MQTSLTSVFTGVEAPKKDYTNGKFGSHLTAEERAANLEKAHAVIRGGLHVILPERIKDALKVKLGRTPHSKDVVAMFEELVSGKVELVPTSRVHQTAAASIETINGERRYTVAQAARSLGQTNQWLRNRIQRGAVKAIRRNPQGKNAHYFVMESEVELLRKVEQL